MPENEVLPTFEHPQRLPGRFHFPARMTVLPLAGRRLALVSPIPIDAALAARLAALGEVCFLIAPNLLHHLYLGSASQRFPEARVLAPERLRKKRPDLRFDGSLEHDLPALLTDSVEVLKFDGAPALDEFVFYDRARKTLLVTDLVFNVRKPRGLMAHLVLSLVGCHGRLAQSRALRWMVQDRARASVSVERILMLDFDRLVMAHGDIVESGARVELRRALSWLLPERAALPALG